MQGLGFRLVSYDPRSYPGWDSRAALLVSTNVGCPRGPNSIIPPRVPRKPRIFVFERDEIQ